MITIFQINLSDEEIDAVNDGEVSPCWDARASQQVARMLVVML